MSSQTLTLSSELSFPVKCKCSDCKSINDGTISFTVTGEAITNTGSPFGRKERAQKNAEENLRKNLKYHIIKLYEESSDKPDRFIRYMNESKCPVCGKTYPWADIDGAIQEDSPITVKKGLFPSIISLSSKKFKSTPKKVKDAIDNIPREYIPVPAMSQAELVEQYDLGDVDGSSPADSTALFMHL